MKVVYIADDGTEFENEYDCEAHENLMAHKSIFGVSFYNVDDEELPNVNDDRNIYADDFIYQEAEKVIVHNEGELSDLKWIAEECGYCEFEQITSVGTWVRWEKCGNGIFGTWVRWEECGNGIWEKSDE